MLSLNTIGNLLKSMQSKNLVKYFRIWSLNIFYAKMSKFIFFSFTVTLWIWNVHYLVVCQGSRQPPKRRPNNQPPELMTSLSSRWIEGTKLPATFYIVFRLAAHWTRLFCLLWVDREHWIRPRWWLNYVLVDKEAQLYLNYYST